MGRQPVKFLARKLWELVMGVGFLIAITICLILEWSGRDLSDWPRLDKIVHRIDNWFCRVHERLK